MAVFDIIMWAVSGVLFVISLIITILQNIKSGKRTPLLEVFRSLVDYVGKAESIFGKGTGPAKLQWCLTMGQFEAIKRKISVSNEELTKEIETILATPEKKNVTNEQLVDNNRTDIMK